MQNKKILIISNNALYESDANGRTLGNLVERISKNNLVQICVNGSKITPKYIENCYVLSDKDVLKSVFKLKCNVKKVDTDNIYCGDKQSNIKIKRTALISLMRELVWKQAVWKINIKEILGGFSPEVIIVQLGDCAFTLNIAYKAAKMYGAKIVIFTTEDYYFKKHNYFDANKKDIFYLMFREIYKRTLRKISGVTKCFVCNTKYLADLYQKEFNVETCVVMNAANNIAIESNEIDQNGLVYAGNLGLGRHRSLIEIAKQLYLVSPEYFINVYGNFSKEIRDELEKQSNIHLKGFASYQEILKQQALAKLILHMESFDAFYKDDLKAAFSTKIPDALASGTPLFIYAPEQFAETIYLKENNCAFVCDKQENLYTELKEAVENNRERGVKTKNARQMVNQNHDSKRNQERFMKILEKD